MKSKTIFLILTTILITGCSSLEKDYNKISNETTVYKTVSQNYLIENQWWFEYNDKTLNALIKRGLANNKDLIKSAININQALYQANLIGADLLPQFSSSFDSSASKNIKTGGGSTVNHSGSFNISYEIDLWQRMTDAKTAKEWEYKATVEDYETAKLTLINNIINTYFAVMYLDNYIEVSKKVVNSYIKIDEIVSSKLKYGTADILEKNEAEREVIKSRNDLINYEKQKKEQESLLRNLLNLKPDEKLEISSKNILDVKNIGVDINIPVSVIGNRPDIKAYEYRLKSSFKDAEADEKQLYPNITLSSSISSQDEKIKDTFNTPLGFGSVSINLPFLNWNKIKWNVKISRAQYEEAKENFEQGITTALNEIDYNYFLYTKEKDNFDNLTKIYEYDKIIAQNYGNKYNYGKVELKDWITSLNNEAYSKLSLINSKYQLIQTENKIYQSMGGKLYKK